MNTPHDPPVLIEPEQAARACVIWLHGLGADGNDFAPIVPQLRLPGSAAVRFVFPHAPVRPVTVNNGHRMRAWYDIADIELTEQLDTEGVLESADYLKQLVEEQVQAGIPLQRIVLAGFSQGGVVALECALQMPQKPAGVLALSTYLLRAEGQGAGLDVWFAHGSSDSVVPLAAARNAVQGLRDCGANVDFHEYPMEHSVHPEEVGAIGAWLRAKLT